MRVCILGSCVSRDIFSEKSKETIDIVLYAARTSIGSIFSSQPFDDVYSKNLTSAFQARLVAMDIEKRLTSVLATIDADVILVDLVDERFNLLVMPDQSRCTLSSELIAAGGSEHPGATIVPSGSPEFMMFWENGWVRLLQLLKDRGLLSRVLVNTVFYQPATESGEGFSANWVGRCNETLSKMYDILRKSLPTSQFLEYGNLLTCPDDHQWGKAPFHFSRASQDFALGRIMEMEVGLRS
ncbi:DUF6270 domain-containing protein [Achromobacter sp. JUb104]|uniref:DUF6270 domain-containing protein n=1 Tax=Achromobacter sp. JUb104 TaxID=2940590 RepID=UPI0021692798|nr:DUF6270 domain-containing protein [Achromobacter sp. JUb104]